MKIWNESFIGILVALALLVPSHVSHSQLRLQIKKIDGFGLPVIRLHCLLTDGGSPVGQPAGATYVLTDNGLPVQLTVDCPDNTQHNSVVVALDNSRMMKVYLAKLREAVKLLLDSLHTGDEAALVTFSDSIDIPQVFTTDSTLLHHAVDSMKLVGWETPVWDATLLSINELAKRAGKKTCVVLTNWIDNKSSANVADVIAAAQAAGVKVFPVGFSNKPVDEFQLDELAVQTGGKYFRAWRDSGLAAIFKEIAEETVAPTCVLSYATTNCTDTVRDLHLEAHTGKGFALCDTAYHSPFRKDTLHIRLFTGKGPVHPPGSNIFSHFHVDFWVFPEDLRGMRSSFRFLLRYDPYFMTWMPTGGSYSPTLWQWDMFNVQQLREGVLQVDAELLRPTIAFQGMDIFQVNFRPTSFDSSRLSVISIDSVSFTAGCPNFVIPIQDTVEFCACVSPVYAWMDSMRIAESGSEVLIPIYASDTTFAGSFQFILDLQTDTTKMFLEGFDPGPNSLKGVTLRWEKLDSGRYRVYGEGVKDKRDSMLVVARFHIIKQKNTERVKLAIPQLKAYAHCCSALPSVVEQGLLVDGVCNPLVVRKNVATLRQSIPNPVRDKAVIPFEIHGSLSSEQYFVRLRLYNESGSQVAVLFEGYLNRGRQKVGFDASRLSAGSYYYSLQCGEEVQIRSLHLVK